MATAHIRVRLITAASDVQASLASLVGDGLRAAGTLAI